MSISQRADPPAPSIKAPSTVTTVMYGSSPAGGFFIVERHRTIVGPSGTRAVQPEPNRTHANTSPVPSSQCRTESSHPK